MSTGKWIALLLGGAAVYYYVSQPSALPLPPYTPPANPNAQPPNAGITPGQIFQVTPTPNLPAPTFRAVAGRRRMIGGL